MEGASRVLVFARARPVGQETCCVEVDDEANTVLVRDESCIAERVLRGEALEAAMHGPETKKFNFDGVFPCDASQRDVFAQVGLPVLQEFMKGFNGTIFAYGQTGSGKTFSLLNQTPASEDAGLLPRLVAGLFLHVARDRASAYRVQCAAMQVYNEQVDDLLNQTEQVGAGQGLTIQSGGVVPDLTWVNCTHPDEMLGAFTRARSNIVYAETKMNKCSSRSHAVFQIKISKRQRASGAAATSAAEQGAGPQLVESVSAMLSVVDLAGSERVKRSGSEGARFTEATAINRSLLALGNVVSALAERKKHVPLRDSKLTRLLEGSIGGNCKTSLLVCCSPATENHGETLNTLDFASRAMRVEVNAKVNTSLVEVSTATLLADLTQATAADFGIPLGPDPEELAELRRQSSSAEARAAAAERKAAQQQRAAASAEKEVQQELIRATEAARAAEAARTAQAAEAAAAQQATQEAEQSATRAAAQAAAAEEARASVAAQLEVAKASAQKTTQAAEKRAAELATELAEVTHAARDKEEALSAVEKVNVQLARLRDNEAQLQQRLECSTAEAVGMKHERDTGLARAQAAEDRVRELEAERDRLARKHEAKIREVEQRSTALQRALTEAAARAERLEVDLAQTKQASAEELASVEAARAEAETRLRGQQTALEAELAGRHAAVERAETEVAVQSEGRKEASDRAARAQAALEEAVAAFEMERSALTSVHTASSEAAATAFEARLNQLRAGFDIERQALERRLEEHQHRMVQQETGWRNSREEAVQEAWETGNVQQRRLAAAFKAARCVAAAKEQTLRQTHEELNSRFAARESREEDLRALAEQRKRMETQQKELAARDAAVDDLHRSLQNRDETDRIFGDQGRGRTAGRAPLAPGPMWGMRTRRVTRAGSAGPRSCPPLSAAQTLTVGKTLSLDEERKQDRDQGSKLGQATAPKADCNAAAPRSQRLASRSPLPL